MSLIANLVDAGWSPEGAAFLASRAHERRDVQLFLAKFGGDRPPRINHPQKPKAVIGEALRWRVWERDDFRCKHCGARHFLRCDHIVAESRGGPTTFENLQTLCRVCNSKKGTS